MRQCLVVLLAALILCSADLFAEDHSPPPSAVDLKDAAVRKFYDQYAKELAEYRKRLAQAVEKSDQIEIFLLNFQAVKERLDIEAEDVEGKRYFSIGDSTRAIPILDTHILSAEERGQLLPLLMDTIIALKPQGGGAFCHIPIHGVRVRSGEDVIFEGTFCYLCKNFEMEYPSEILRVGLSSSKFEETMKRLMPIPESVLKKLPIGVDGETGNREKGSS